MELGTISAVLGITSFGCKTIKITPDMFENIKKFILEEDFAINKPFLKSFKKVNSFMLKQYPNSQFKSSIEEVNKYSDDRIVKIFEITDQIEFDSNFELGIQIKLKFNEHLKLFYEIELEEEFLDEWFNEFNKNYTKNLAKFINKNKDLYGQLLLKTNLMERENIDELLQLATISEKTLNSIKKDISNNSALISEKISTTEEKIVQSQTSGFNQLNDRMSSIEALLKSQNLDNVKLDNQEQQKLVDYLRTLIKECKFEEAISTFKELFSKIEKSCDNSKLAIIYTNYGICYLGIDNEAEAIRSFERALEYDGNFENARFNIFVTQINKGNLDEAKETFKLLNPEKNKYFEAKFALFLVDGNYDDAQRLLDKNADKYEEINLKKAKLYFHKQDYENTINALNIHLQDNINDYVALSLLIHARYNQSFGQSLLMYNINYIKDRFIIDGPIINEEQIAVLNDIKTKIISLLSMKENNDAKLKQAKLSNKIILASLYIVERSFNLAEKIILELENEFNSTEEILFLKAKFNYSTNNFIECISIFEELKQSASQNFDRNEYRFSLFGADLYEKYIDETNNLRGIDDNLFAFRLLALIKLNYKEQAEQEAYNFYQLNKTLESKILLADLLNSIDKGQDATIYYDELMDELADNEYSWFKYQKMGLFYLKNNALEKAQKCFEISWNKNKSIENIISAEELSLIYYHQKHQESYSKSLKVCQEIIALDEKNKLAQQITLNLQFFLFCNYKQITNNYENELYYENNFNNLEGIVGESYLKLKEYNKTLGIAKKLLQKNKILAYSFKVRAYFGLKEYEQAESNLNELIEQEPYHPDARRAFLGLYFDFLRNYKDENDMQEKTKENIKQTFKMLMSVDYFGDNTPLKQGKLDTSSPEKIGEDISALIESYSDKNELVEFQNNLNNIYNSGILPLITLATLYTADRPLEYMLQRIYSSYFNIYSNSITTEIRNKENESIFKIQQSNEKPIIVIDIHTLLVLIELDLFHRLLEIVNIRITPFTYNLITEAIKTYGGKDYLYMRLNRDNSWFVEKEPPEYMRKFLSFFKDNLEFLKCSIEEVDITSLDTSLFSNLTIFMPRENSTNHIQEGLLAKQKNYIVCCSDNVLNQFYFKHNLSIISPQSILNLLLIKEKIDRNIYVDELVQLCKFKYKHFSINAPLLTIPLLNSNKNNPIEDFKILLDTLNGEGIDIKTVAEVLADLIVILNELNLPYNPIVLDIIFDKMSFLSSDGTLTKKVLIELQKVFFKFNNNFIQELNKRFINSLNHTPTGTEFFKDLFLVSIERIAEQNKNSVLILQNDKIEKICQSAPAPFRKEIKEYAEKFNFIIFSL